MSKTTNSDLLHIISVLSSSLVHTYTHAHTAEVEKNKTMCRCETPNVWGSTPSDVYISRHYEMPLRAKRKKHSSFENLEVN